MGARTTAMIGRPACFLILVKDLVPGVGLPTGACRWTCQAHSWVALPVIQSSCPRDAWIMDISVRCKTCQASHVLGLKPAAMLNFLSACCKWQQQTTWRAAFRWPSA